MGGRVLPPLVESPSRTKVAAATAAAAGAIHNIVFAAAYASCTMDAAFRAPSLLRREILRVSFLLNGGATMLLPAR